MPCMTALSRHALILDGTHGDVGCTVGMAFSLDTSIFPPSIRVFVPFFIGFDSVGELRF
jgi:hypothetical protein